MGYEVFEQDIQGHFRFAGYGVVAYCDHPQCNAVIDRGMDYACCGGIHFDGSCGGFYCIEHETPVMHEDELEDLDEEETQHILSSYGLTEVPTFDEYGIAKLCNHPPIEFKEHPDWIKHISTDKTWSKFRKEKPEQFKALQDMEKIHVAE